ncbi:MAG: SAM-dependent methyltransferase [Acidobacteriota bacterium]
MKQSQASRTAEFMALFRALESFRPSNTRLFQDRFAQGFLKPSLQIVAQLSRIPLFGSLVPFLIDRQWPGARASGIARTRFIDDMLVKSLQEGIEQVVILGAGFDCRAYRIPGIEAVDVYEVDHPATLMAKHKYLQLMLNTVPSHVTFVEIDFNQQRLAEVLAASGFLPSRRSFFIWEGVTNYLSEDAVDTTLRFISTAAPASQLIFTYIHRAVLDNPAQFDGTENLIHLLQQEDEPWTFGLYPDQIPSYLETRGFQLVDDIGSLQYRARYMNPQGRHMNGYQFYRIVLASVV